jgi:hypothetical protein
MPTVRSLQRPGALLLAVTVAWVALVGSAFADDWSRLSRGEVYVPEDLLGMPQIDAALRDRLGDAYADYVDVVGREQNFDPNEENLRRGILTGLSWSPDLRFPGSGHAYRCRGAGSMGRSLGRVGTGEILSSPERLARGCTGLRRPDRRQPAATVITVGVGMGHFEDCAR